jgi:hypothetical protein
MAFGAAYDAAFGLAITLVPTWAATMLKIEMPADPFYLRLNGVFLVLLGAIYALPAVRPERFHPIAPISAAGRVAGFAVFALAWREGRPATFLVLAVLDLAIALVTLAAWMRARGSPPSP